MGRLLEEANDDEVRSRRNALVVLTETQTRAAEVQPTRTFFAAHGYECIIIRGVLGLGERRERAGVIVAWDAKSMQLVPIGRRRHQRVIVIKGRIMHVRFRIAGGKGA